MKYSTQTVDETNYAELIALLVERDQDLKHVIAILGEPPIWIRPPGFSTLIHIILEQQVSIASALAAFERLKITLTEITPQSFLRLTDDELKIIGFSRQKTLYARNLANAVATGNLDLAVLENLPDDKVKTELIKLKGIGNWTADVYLLMCLRRADAFPAGDLGIIIAAQKLKNLTVRPTTEELQKIAENWRPWRGVATRILWHFYLNQNKFDNKNLVARSV